MKDRLLHRNVPKSFIKDREITSQTFTPFPKDDNLLSVYNSSYFDAEGCFNHYTQNNSSIGVMSVSEQECEESKLPVIDDNIPFKGHSSIDFRNLKSRREKATAAKELKKYAIKRDWTYQP